MLRFKNAKNKAFNSYSLLAAYEQPTIEYLPVKELESRPRIFNDVSEDSSLGMDPIPQTKNT